MSLPLATDSSCHSIARKDCWRGISAKSQEYLPLHTDSVLSLPPEYQQPPKEQPFYAERFGLSYLQNLASSAVSYCDTNSASSLTCFRTKIDSKNQRIDSFCIGGPATFDSKNFGLDCSLRQWSTEEAAQGIPRLEQFPIYWYGTGPSPYSETIYG